MSCKYGRHSNGRCRSRKPRSRSRSRRNSPPQRSPQRSPQPQPVVNNNRQKKTAAEEAYIEARVQAALNLMAKEQTARATNKSADVAQANRAAGSFLAGLKKAATSKPAIAGAIALAMTGGVVAAYKSGWLTKKQAEVLAEVAKKKPSMLQKVLAAAGGTLGAAGKGVIATAWRPKTYLALAGTAAYLDHRYRDRARAHGDSRVQHIARHLKSDLGSTDLGKRYTKATEIFNTVGSAIDGVHKVTHRYTKARNHAAHAAGIVGQVAGRAGRLAGTSLQMLASGVSQGVSKLRRNSTARARQNAQKLMTNPAFVAMLLQRSSST